MSYQEFISYQDFVENVIAFFKEKLPKDADIKLHKITKNNGLHLDGLTIMTKETNISPNFYLNYYYEDYLEHGDLDKVLNLILTSYKEQPQLKTIDISFFTDFEKVKKNIAYKIVNFERNRELLSEIPHIPYLDLAIVFFCLMNHEYFGNATTLIRNQHLELWQITDRELYQLAIENTPRLLPHHFLSMHDLLNDPELLSNLPEDVILQSSDNSESDCDENQSHVESPMYVLSNQSKCFGASTILYLNLLEEIAEQFHSSFYLLPSSIHEVILVPDSSPSKLKDYSNMVHEVNTNHVPDDEILSDHAYFYNKDEKAIIYY